ncbi:hypothetical protein Poli38472_002516 [Pythium oligandrum]|uniref:Myb-like domain-containing protein n=1 Tax=Pythium oligandrum TaxID=41045 RepID=A0A8K1CIZ1_PYTOL|nr:hypothetical protein Poli38472_002516 [Pythium oligandrum]|eukprot:TMW63575.1 hypothetical protein Poli38472_002516 [Pythium oligandrum]
MTMMVSDAKTTRRQFFAGTDDMCLLACVERVTPWTRPRKNVMDAWEQVAKALLADPQCALRTVTAMSCRGRFYRLVAQRRTKQEAALRKGLTNDAYERKIALLDAMMTQLEVEEPKSNGGMVQMDVDKPRTNAVIGGPPGMSTDNVSRLVASTTGIEIAAFVPFDEDVSVTLTEETGVVNGNDRAQEIELPCMPPSKKPRHELRPADNAPVITSTGTDEKPAWQDIATRTLALWEKKLEIDHRDREAERKLRHQELKLRQEEIQVHRDSIKQLINALQDTNASRQRFTTVPLSAELGDFGQAA